MARGPKKPNFGKKRNFDKHNNNNQGGPKKRLLDMGREKYFRFDLGDILDEIEEISENKNNISATIYNKLKTNSLDDARDFLKTIKKDHNMKDADVEALEKLFKRYTKFR